MSDVTERGVMTVTLRNFEVVIVAKCLIVLADVPRSVDERVAQITRTLFGHPSVASAPLAGLPNNGVQPGKAAELAVFLETADISDFA